jgi:hypothetical protein
MPEGRFANISEHTSDGNTLSYYWRADTLVIRFYHPNAHMESAKLYSLLSGCVKQALDNQLK